MKNKPIAELEIAVYWDGKREGRFKTLRFCSLCWTLFLTTLGLQPEYLQTIAPQAYQSVYAQRQKVIDAKTARKEVRKWRQLIKEERLAQTVVKETLTQLGILKPPDPSTV